MYIYWDDEAFESIVLKEFSKLIKRKTFQYFSLILSYFESYNKCKHLHFPVLCRYKLLGFYFTSSKKKTQLTFHIELKNCFTICLRQRVIFQWRETHVFIETYTVTHVKVCKMQLHNKYKDVFCN